MNWTGALRTVLKGDIVFAPTGRAGEIQLNAEGLTVTMCDLPPGSAAIDMRSVDHPDWVAPGQWRQRCDFLVFLTRNDEECVVLVEMKKTLTGERRPEGQLLRSRPLARYLADLGASVRRREVAPRCCYLLVAERRSARFSKQRMKSEPGKPAYVRGETGAKITAFVQKRISVEAVISAGMAPQPNERRGQGRSKSVARR